MFLTLVTENVDTFHFVLILFPKHIDLNYRTVTRRCLRDMHTSTGGFCVYERGPMEISRGIVDTPTSRTNFVKKNNIGLLQHLELGKEDVQSVMIKCHQMNIEYGRVTYIYKECVHVHNLVAYSN